MVKGPVLIELDEKTPAPSVAEAAPVPDLAGGEAPSGQAMQVAARIAAGKPSRLAQLFWGLLSAVLVAVLSAAAWQFVTDWIAAYPLVGWGLTALLGAFVLVCLIIALRELAALSRLRRLDGLRRKAAAAQEAGDLGAARSVTQDLTQFYAGRAEMDWARARFGDLEGDQMDADALLALAERELITPLDQAARREVEAAARQVATVTALVPLALADVVAALSVNIRMIRRVAEIYGGRSGSFGAWRLTRAVLGHLVATGAVAVGDDMLEPFLGGSILGKLSRRFGEGLVNGALTARVGVAALEVCRPLPFHATPKPKARDLVRGALGGLFDGKGEV